MGDAQSGTVAQSQFLRDVEVVADGQDTASSTDTLADNHQGTVVERRVLEEDVLYELLADAGIDFLTRSHDIVQRCGALYDYQGAHLLLAHRHAGHDDGHDGTLQLLCILLSVVVGKEASQGPHALVAANVVEKLADVLLEQDDESDDTHRHQLVENAAQ